MSNKKQSSIDKFVKQLKRKGLLLTEDSEYIVAYLEAKAMHKEEIEMAYINGQQVNSKSLTSLMMMENSESYYNETFGGGELC